MMWTLLILIVVLFLVYLAGGKKAQIKYKTLPVPDDVKPKRGPIATGMLEIMAIAGGIYLALIGLMQFLQLNLPETVAFFGVTFDPLATLSLLFAILQPYLGGIFKKYYGNNQSD